MKLIDALKERHNNKVSKKQQGQEDAALYYQIQEIDNACELLKNEYETGLKQYPSLVYEDENKDFSVNWNHIVENINGQDYSIGASKVTNYSNTNIPSKYEFLFVDVDAQGEICGTRYYDMSVMGNFTHKRGLASINVKYLANVDNRKIPCIATYNINSSDFENVDSLAVMTPRVMPAVQSVQASYCMPSSYDMNKMLTEFVKINNTTNVQNQESFYGPEM